MKCALVKIQEARLPSRSFIALEIEYHASSAEIKLTNVKATEGYYKVVDTWERYDAGIWRRTVIRQFIVAFGDTPPPNTPYTYTPPGGGNSIQIPLRRTISQSTRQVPLYLHGFRLRGQPITSLAPEEVIVQDVASISEHGLREGTLLVMRYVANETKARKLLNILLLRNSKPKTQYRELVFVFDDRNENLALKHKILRLDIGSVVHVVNRLTDHSGTYAITKIEYSKKRGINRVKFQLFYFTAEGYAIVGSSTVEGDDYVGP